MTLKNEVALVTGASRGIGRAIAESLGRQGATVIGTATSESGAAGISEHFSAAGLEGGGAVLNVAETDSVARLMRQVGDDYGAVTVLVNNAGVTRDNLLMRMKEDEWLTVLDTDLTSMYRMCKACVRGMIKAKRGRIVNITSVVGAMGNAGQSNYAAAKAGVIGFTKALARELASRAITVNAVAPGFIETDMTRRLPEEQRDALRGEIPLGRLGTPDDVAAVVAFLAAPAAGYITGETVHVNGGMYMT
ncbi:MAG: 3-oxoacyl-ACP reductase FabG [Gammaproteobacteria bacterium]|nr:3-oxoacyl-ACP reductase FabG [Gammaproteobacteria bacterium]